MRAHSALRGQPTIVGTLPVLVARVSGEIVSPALEGMRCRMTDWNLTPIAEGIVRDSRLRIPADLPVFEITLERAD